VAGDGVAGCHCGGAEEGSAEGRAARGLVLDVGEWEGIGKGKVYMRLKSIMELEFYGGRAGGLCTLRREFCCLGRASFGEWREHTGQLRVIGRCI